MLPFLTTLTLAILVTVCGAGCAVFAVRRRAEQRKRAQQTAQETRERHAAIWNAAQSHAHSD